MKPYKILTTRQRLQYGYYQVMDRLFSRERVFRWHYNSRRKLFQNIHNQLKQKGRKGTTHEIDRVANISLKDFKEKYVKKGIPVIIEGGAKDWACTNWSLDYFKELYGNDEILLINHEDIHSDYDVITLREVIEGMHQGSGKYYRFYPLLQRHPERLKDFDYEWMRNARNWFAVGENFQVFMGGKGTSTPLHNANANNIFTQAHGEKEWYLYHPYYTLIFDPDPAENISRSASYRQGGTVFNPFQPNFETHPLFEYIDRVHVHLKEGDILYNPPYWWHTVRNLTDSIGVGYRWLSPQHSFKISPLYFLLDLTVRNPSIFKSFKLARKDVNLIQLAETGRLEEYLQKNQNHGTNSN